MSSGQLIHGSYTFIHETRRARRQEANAIAWETLGALVRMNGEAVGWREVWGWSLHFSMFIITLAQAGQLRLLHSVLLFQVLCDMHGYFWRDNQWPAQRILHKTVAATTRQQSSHPPALLMSSYFFVHGCLMSTNVYSQPSVILDSVRFVFSFKKKLYLWDTISEGTKIAFDECHCHRWGWGSLRTFWPSLEAGKS